MYKYEIYIKCYVQEMLSKLQQISTISVCDKRAGSDPAEYIWVVNGVDVPMRCAPGTVFSEEECQCVNGQGGDG